MTLPLILPGKVHASETNRTALEQANHDLAVYCMEILENRPDLASSHRINILREECYSENFTEHSPSIKDGREALLSVFEKRYKKYPELSMSIKRTVVEGGLSVDSLTCKAQKLTLWGLLVFISLESKMEGLSSIGA